MKVIWVNELGSGDAHIEAYITTGKAQAQAIVDERLSPDRIGSWPHPMSQTDDGVWRNYYTQSEHAGWRNWDAIWEEAERMNKVRDITRWPNETGVGYCEWLPYARQLIDWVAVLHARRA